MKALFTTLIAVYSFCSCFAQGEMYRLYTSHDIYSDFFDGTPFLSGTGKYADTIPLGFDVTIAGVTNSTLYTTIRGSISTTGTTYEQPHLESFSTEHSGGSYSYQITGPEGSRIVKLQFRNVRFDHDMNSADYMNYQVWLYEGDKTIEVRFGKSSVANAEWSYYYNMGGPAIGMKNLWLKGDATAPATDTTSQTRLTGTPDNGQTYQFIYKPVTVKDAPAEHNDISVFPNPVSDKLYIHTGNINSDAWLTDVSGKIISRASLAAHEGSIDMSRIQPGMYFLHIDQRVFKILK